MFKPMGILNVITTLIIRLYDKTSAFKRNMRVRKSCNFSITLYHKIIMMLREIISADTLVAGSVIHLLVGGSANSCHHFNIKTLFRRAS
jgi:hypothetical protein